MKAISPESKAATNDYDSKQIYSTVYSNKRMWPEISAFGNTLQKVPRKRGNTNYGK